MPLNNDVKSFHRIILSPILCMEIPFIVLDFEFEALDKASILSTPNIILPRERFDLHDTQCRASKSYNIKQLKQVRQKVELAKDAKSRLATEAHLHRRVFPETSLGLPPSSCPSVLFDHQPIFLGVPFGDKFVPVPPSTRHNQGPR